MADENGEVPGGQETIRALLGDVERKHVIAALDDLERDRLIKRVGHTRGQRLFVLVLVPFSSDADQRRCEVCEEPVARMRGAKRCPKCIQIQRREWKSELLTIWRNGQRQGWSDDKIAFTAHVRLKRPLWGYAEDGVQGSGSGSGEGIVPALVEMGLVDASMMERARFARRGGEPDEVD